MICKIRKWLLSDAADLIVAISNKKVQANLRDGIPYPYTVQDGINFISTMLSADENDTFAFAITVDEKAIGSIGAYRQENIHRQTAELGYYIAELFRLKKYPHCRGYNRGYFRSRSEKSQCFQWFQTTDYKKYGLKAARRAPQFSKR